MLLIIAAGLLAYSNGANDNFKGVATLFGSKTTPYRQALSWATATTFLGSLAAIFLAQALIKNFSGKGLVPEALVHSPAFAVAVALGAGLTVLLATRIGMPVSTTHGLVGALAGVGIVAAGSQFNYMHLGKVFLFPLLVSPLMAATVSLLTYSGFKGMRKATGVSKETCVCIGNKYVPVRGLEGSATLSAAMQPEIRVSDTTECVERYQGRILGIEFQSLLDYAHYLSAGVVSFARGLNDTPKIVGLLLLVPFMNLRIGLLAMGIAIALGGILNAKKVAQTISQDITSMDHGQGFSANIVTGLLVTTASIHGLPVSTTHVSVGSIFGIGTAGGKMDVHVVRNIVLSWVLTLPVAAVLGMISYALINVFI
ncbi:MAG: anion permease [Fidelibacterota bacterium]